MGQSNKGLYPFVLNSIPKSGTHLLKQILMGIPGMQHYPDKGMFGHYHFQTPKHFEWVRTLSENEFVNGHLFYSSEWEDFFKKLNMKQIFVLRDPRDVIVSYAYFIPTLKIHPLYTTFTQDGFTHKDRLKFLIEGGDPISQTKYVQPDVHEWFTSFSKWMDKENVFTVRFEELNGSQILRFQVLHRMVKFLWGEDPVPFTRPIMVGKMIQNINTATSPTFRKGGSGGWKHELDDELKGLFKEKAGQLLISLGYEKDTNW
ncbi:sulfotransferase domain-containing protein [Pseudalkalibacillus berkeleyi]|uniref:Sulfotransferase domain-containing protein n=1 Tax=Pseudalkalibacillus berkeleyi TaxID=1069813 RepID=A0ABS9GVP9_9BACL|nr:sulfotransferase domain-containing protein [Pseudalkalibacillus berkeleyi]MCF6136888.1 sulfotransferase domain-containing protein [Pseudalkalibacillus berkeleyi]